MGKVLGVVFSLVILAASIDASAQMADLESLSRRIGQKHRSKTSFTSVDSVMRMPDSTCSCHAFVPLEIVASSIIAGIPAYWGYRGFFDDTSGFRPEIMFTTTSALLYMVSLAPVAEWTSGCEANWWHAAWIGFGSNIACSLLYWGAYGHNHVLNLYKINWPEFVALGVAPTVIASVVFNLFLQPRPKDRENHSSVQGMYIVPSVNWDKSVAMNVGFRF